MITLVLTNRNRDLHIIKKCLDSLKKQSNNNFNCILVDYGSEANYILDLSKLLGEYPRIQLITCPVSGQLWNKSRAINIGLNKCFTTYFLVADIDLIFHSQFIEKAVELAKENEVHYFQYGFLSKTESLLNKEFSEYKVDFVGNDEVTGTTIFPTEVLKSLNGYDEFYHGWGAEDTDIHIRIKNAGFKVIFYDDQILVKHQWHPKTYRSSKSKDPFHSQLERINHDYMHQSYNCNRTTANNKMGFGIETISCEYEKLDEEGLNLQIDNSEFAFQALLAQLANFSDETVKFVVTKVSFFKLLKNKIKHFIGKKNIDYLSMNTINNAILIEIIKNYRNNPYQYTFDRQKNLITLTVRF